jgi:AraC-like DNA-binding protein
MPFAIDFPLAQTSGSLFLKQTTAGKKSPEMATLLSRHFSPNALRVLGRPDDFRADLLTAQIGSMHVSTLAYNTEVELKVQTLDDHLLVTTQFQGQQQVWSQGKNDCGNVGFVVVDSTSAEITKKFSADSHRLNLRISRASLGSMWKRVMGTAVCPPQIFEPFLATQAMRRRWWAHMQLLLSYIDAPVEGIYGVRMRKQIEEGILLFLLFEHTHDASHCVDGDPDAVSASDRRLRRAEDYIRANLHEPLGLADIAAASDSSIRSLTAAFRTRHATSPMKFAENLRLDAAHATLGSGKHGVTDVASELGFSNMGRFAAAYRWRFGVSPSRTLKRGGTADLPA